MYAFMIVFSDRGILGYWYTAGKLGVTIIIFPNTKYLEIHN